MSEMLNNSVCARATTTSAMAPRRTRASWRHSSTSRGGTLLQQACVLLLRLVGGDGAEGSDARRLRAKSSFKRCHPLLRKKCGKRVFKR